MAWSTPLTAVSNATLTAAQWNASVRDNLLESSPAKVTAAGQYLVGTAANAIAVRAMSGTPGVSNSQTTTLTSYNDLPSGTVGPTASSVIHGPVCLVAVGARIQNDTNTAEGYAGFAMTGTNVVAASDNSAAFYQSLAVNSAHRGSAVTPVTLTPGTTTFTMKYRVSAGTGTFATRQIAVIPF